ncbi:SET domain-containing protein [Cryomyces minteri]|uniref:SET domain-containing protein n=1 Tax=Cryomyces minteri TaxID=331657 RepID=A0A4U0VEB5_9PEZI|nr:SET domain-containing protein [Cryomyces minteri]
MTALEEACQDFAWSEKELRNKMSIWRGYKELKDAGGWAVLVFTGMGIYRFCKYRVSFNTEALIRLKKLRQRLEVAADTIHPRWRQLLSIIGESTQRTYSGHPHDWVVTDAEPIPLRETYLQWDPDFTFEHLDWSVVDRNAWEDRDPRAVTALTDGASQFREAQLSANLSVSSQKGLRTSM